MTNLEEPMDIDEGWKQIKAKAIDVLLEQLQQGFDEKARPFDVSYFLLGPLCPIPLLPPTTPILFHPWHCIVSPLPRQLTHFFLNPCHFYMPLLQNKDYMEVYTICYNLCTQRAPHNFSEKLYEYHGITMTGYLGEHVLPSLQSRNGDLLMAELIKRWKHHKIMNKWMKRFFTYLDRYYVKHHSHSSLQRVGIESFKKEVYNHIRENVVTAMLASIEKERNGEEVDHQQLKRCVAVFETMGQGDMDCYINDFEDALLTKSETYYNGRAAEWMSTDDTPAYLIKAEAALKAKKKRVEDYLIGSTEPKLLSVCEKQLLEVHQMELLNRETSGCAALLKNNKVDDLTRMFQLFGRLDEGLVPMSKIVESYFNSCGQDLMDQRKQTIAQQDKKKESAIDPTLVKSFIDLHARCQSFGKCCARKHARPQTCLWCTF
jgi:cullin 1